MEIRTLRASELELAWELDADSFHVSTEKKERSLRFCDPDRVLGAFEGERLVGMLRMLPLGQFFGGRAVPMGGLSAVAVAPDWRGRGLAGQLLRGSIAAMRERGERISTLYPAATSLYRSVGWELAGSHAFRRIDPADLLGLARPAGGRARPMQESDAEAVRECYRRLAAPSNGCLDRPPPWWERRFESWRDQSRFVYEDETGVVDGYLVYQQLDGEWSALGGDFGLVASEIVANTRDASLGLWRLLGSWSSQVDQLIYRGPVEDPRLLLAPQQRATLLAEIRWMVRVLDAPGAVAARGFPRGLELEVPLRLRDPVVAANDAGFVLSVQEGRGELARCESPGRSGAVSGPELGIEAFASLYSGWARSADLARVGLLAGGSPDQRSALDAAFAGPTAWMLDEF
jgi:predicted acetyltransferase